MLINISWWFWCLVLVLPVSQTPARHVDSRNSRQPSSVHIQENFSSSTDNPADNFSESDNHDDDDDDKYNENDQDDINIHTKGSHSILSALRQIEKKLQEKSSSKKLEAADVFQGFKAAGNMSTMLAKGVFGFIVKFFHSINSNSSECNFVCVYVRAFAKRFNMSGTAAFFSMIGIFIAFVLVCVLIGLFFKWRNAPSRPRRFYTANLKLDTGGKADSQYGMVVYTIEYDNKKQLLKVNIVQCLDLVSADPPINAFAIVRMGPDKSKKRRLKRHLRTKTIKDSSDPVYNESITFRIRREKLMVKSVIFEIFDSNKGDNNTLIGELELPIKNLDQNQYIGRPYEASTNLYVKAPIQTGNGDVCVVLRYNESKKNLQVTILEARKLRFNKSLYKTPPPVWFSIELTLGQTKVRSYTTDKRAGSLNPYFNATFDFLCERTVLDAIKLNFVTYYRSLLGFPLILGKILLANTEASPNGQEHIKAFTADLRMPCIRWHTIR